MRTNVAKSKKLLFEGRSTVLNVLFIAINVFGIGIFLNETAVETNPQIAFKVMGVAMFVISTMMLFILKGYYMYSYFARLALGVILLISGFGKLNDPIGFSHVLEQYFQDGALSLKMGELFGWQNYSLENYIPWTLKIAITLAIGEVLLALMLIYHMLYKLAVFLVFGLMAVFTFVSFYASNCDETKMFEHEFSIKTDDAKAKALTLQSQSDTLLTLVQEKNGVLYFSEQSQHICVSNCGCIGESANTFFGLGLTPDILFARNIILLIFVLIIFITQFWMLPNAAFENTIYGITTWIFLLIQGILSAWPWLVVLSGIVLYLTVNVRRFGLKILKTNLGSLLFIMVLLSGILYYVISFEPLTDFRTYAIGNELSHKNNELEKTEQIYVYQHKFTNEMVFLKEENRLDSPIIADTNYVFIRISEHRLNPFENDFSNKFRPTIDVLEIQKMNIEHALILPYLEQYSEELYRVFNKQSGQSDLFREEEFSPESFKDTNLVIEKFIGVHEKNAEFDLSPSILSAELIFIWVVKDIRKISDEHWLQIKTMTDQFSEREYDMVVLGFQRSSVWYEKSEITWKKLLYLNLNKEELNKICRSNACLMVLKKGVVAAKYPIRGLPKVETISSKLRLE